MGYELIKEMKGAYIAPTAQVMGSVRIGERSSVWYGTVIRGAESPIEIGKGSNVQDNCVVHSNPGGKCVILSFARFCKIKQPNRYDSAAA